MKPGSATSTAAPAAIRVAVTRRAGVLGGTRRPALGERHHQQSVEQRQGREGEHRQPGWTEEAEVEVVGSQRVDPRAGQHQQHGPEGEAAGAAARQGWAQEQVEQARKQPGRHAPEQDQPERAVEADVSHGLAGLREAPLDL